jgi:hypothetical protein
MRSAGLAVVLATVTIVPAPGHAHVGAGQTPASTQLVYATAVNADQDAIVDVDPADFVVKEDGKECKVIAVARADSAMQVAILVDDNGTGIFRFGLNGLGELLQGRAEIALSVITNQVQKFFDYTPDSRIWFAGFSRTGVRPATPEGGQLLEGIFATSRELKSREARRPIILALTVGGEEQSPLAARPVLDALHESRASLHVLFVDIPAVRPARPARQPSDLLEGNFNLSRVLGDGPRESGGRRREVLAMKALTSEVQAITRDLLSQYSIAYTRLPSKNPPQKLQISVRRPGVTVIAPSRAPVG